MKLRLYLLHNSTCHQFLVLRWRMDCQHLLFQYQLEKVRVIFFAEEATNAVDVLKDIVDVSDAPGILLRINAVAASVVTAPTAGVVTLAAMVSFDADHQTRNDFGLGFQR